jgi:hypothetical protein
MSQSDKRRHSASSSSSSSSSSGSRRHKHKHKHKISKEKAKGLLYEFFDGLKDMGKEVGKELKEVGKEIKGISHSKEELALFLTVYFLTTFFFKNYRYIRVIILVIVFVFS